jgi:hypothetical protein
MLFGVLFSNITAIDAKDTIGYFLDNNKFEKISFKLIHNLIIFKASVNGVDSLNFILDSGAENNILFSNTLPQNFPKKVLKTNQYVKGFGDKDSIEATILGYNRIKIGTHLLGNHLYFLEIKELDNALSSFVGETISGIIGIEIFKYFKIHIDYAESVITFYPKDDTHNFKSYKNIPVQIIDNKFYTKSFVTNPKNKVLETNLMLDLGESKSIVLAVNESKSIVPNDKVIMSHLGWGINGNLNGLICYYPKVKWGKFKWEKVLVAMPDSSSAMYFFEDKEREGNIGGEIFKRFNIFIDWNNGIFKLKPNNKFHEPFDYNKIGLTISATGKNYEEYYVTEVAYFSPAEIYGISIGDKIIAIDKVLTKDLDINEVLNLLNPKNTKSILLDIERNNIIYTIQMQLFDRL